MDLGWPSWVGVVVDDVGAQRAFYRDVLGFHERSATDDFVEFEFGAGTLELLRRDPSVPQYERPRYQVGFDVADIHSARDALIARGVRPVSGVEGGPDSGAYWAYFSDPEGNVFEITQRLRSPGGE